MAADEPASLYFNYGIPADKARIQTHPTFFEEVDRRGDEVPLVVLDETDEYKVRVRSTAAYGCVSCSASRSVFSISFAFVFRGFSARDFS
jgi:hypothetical protein